MQRCGFEVAHGPFNDVGALTTACVGIVLLQEWRMAEATTVLGLGLIVKSVAGGVLKSAGQEGVKKLYQHFKTRLEDGTIPANHDLQKAVQGSLLEAARAFALGVAAELGEKPPLFQAMRKHLAQGTFTQTPITRMRDVGGMGWVGELLEAAKPGKGGKGGIAADFIIAEGKLTTLLTETKSSGTEFEQRVTRAFTKWLAEHVQHAAQPDCVNEFLKKGWPLEKGGSKRVTFYEVFVMFFREKIKDVPVVRDIFLAQTTSGIAEDVKELLEKAKLSDEGLRHWLDGQFSGLREWLGPKLDKLQAGVDDTKAGIHAVQKSMAAVKLHVTEVKAELASLPGKILQQEPLLAYKRHLVQRFSPHKVIGLGANEPPGQSPARDDITDLFVLPGCTADRLSPEAMQQAMQQQEASPSMLLLPRLEKDRRVVLLADPGMGKSTLIQWLVVALAKRGAAPPQAVRFGKAVPFPIILRDVMPHLQRLHPAPEDWTWARLLDVFLDHYQPEGFDEPLARPLRERGFDLNPVLESAHAWFLVDGLDEVGSVSHREALRRVLWEGFDAYPQARWLITSRVVGYAETEVHVLDAKASGGMEKTQVATGKLLASITFPEQTLKVPMAELLYLAPWNDEQQDIFARQWFTRRLDSKAGPAFGKKFVEAVRSHASTAVIGRVPNVLLLMALLYRYRSYLPHGRAKVYHGISEAYLEQIAATAHIDHRKTEMDLKQKERLLAIIAMHLQVKRESQEQEMEQKRTAGEAKKTVEGTYGEILASEEELESWLCDEFDAANSAAAAEALKAFIHHIADSSGILLPRGQGSYAFTHLSFQEYYAACWLEQEFRRLLNKGRRTRGNGMFGGLTSASAPPTNPVLRMTEKRLAECADTVIWHEPLLFLAEKLEDENDVGTLIEWLFERKKKSSPPLPLNAARLLATFSVDKQVEISLTHRAAIWDMLWVAWVKVQPTGDEGLQGAHPWSVDSMLLGPHPYLAEVQQRLRTRLDKADRLLFTGCTGQSDLAMLSEAKSLRVLKLWGFSELADIGVLASLSKVEEVNFIGCHGLADLSVLASVNNLKTLNITECASIKDATFIETLSNLRTLGVLGCPGLQDLRGLSKLKNLKGLMLMGSTFLVSQGPWEGKLTSVILLSCPQLDSLEFLQGQTELLLLMISGNPSISSLGPMKEAVLLRSIFVMECAFLTDISALTEHVHVRHIDFSDCKALTDISSLAGCSNMEALDLKGTGVKDLRPLTQLSKLKKLDVSGCASMSQAEIEAFEKARPECEVTWEASAA